MFFAVLFVTCVTIDQGPVCQIYPMNMSDKFHTLEDCQAKAKQMDRSARFIHGEGVKALTGTAECYDEPGELLAAVKAVRDQYLATGTPFRMEKFE